MRFANTNGVKRFYKEAEVAQDEDGFVVHLDGRPLKTPAMATLRLASKPLAELIAQEWDTQGATILPQNLPVTKLVNSALDAVVGKEQSVREDIVRYASSDLILYRAAFPKELVEWQSKAWDPILTWARDKLGASFILTEGVNFTDQPAGSLAPIEAALAEYGSVKLAALHAMTTLSGSALIVLAHSMGALSLEEAWDAAHVDERWQMVQWGEDHEAKQRLTNRLRDMTAASNVFFAA